MSNLKKKEYINLKQIKKYNNLFFLAENETF